MDRLHTLGIALAVASAAAAAACDKAGEKGEPPGERVNAVKATQKKVVTVEEFCDVRAPTAAASPAVVFPPLTPGQAPPARGGWRWLNVWATWCKPCIEEMPLLGRWQKELAAEGVKVDVVFLSVDENAQLVDSFRASHPSTPASLLIEKATALQPWLVAIGLGEGAPIPVHVFIDPEDRVRCVRAGGVKENDLPAVKSVLTSG